VKTISLKKVSAVAVASLGFGLLSVVPAQAASATVSTGTSISLSTSTSSVAVGATATTTATFAGTAVSAAACTVATAETYPDGAASAARGATAAAGSSLTAATLAAQATVGGAIAPTTTGTSGAWSASSVLSWTPDVPGIYTVVMTMTTAACSTNSADPAAGQPTATWTVIAGYSVDGAKPNTSFMKQGVSVASSSQATTGGLGTVRVTNFEDNSADTRYYATVSGGTLTAVAGSPNIDKDTADTAGFNYTNGLNLTGGVDFYTDSAATVSDYVDFTVTSATAGNVTISVVKYDASTGIATKISSPVVVFTSALSLDPTVSTSKIYVGTAQNTEATAASTAPTTVAKAAGTDAAGITVIVNDGYGNAVSAADVVVTISGPGLICGATGANGSCTPAARVVATTSNASGKAYINLDADGTAGVATLTFTAGTAVLGTKTVTFYGSAAKYTATTQLNATANGTATTDAVVVCAVDAAGIAVPGSTIYAFSGDATVASVETSDATEATAIATSGTIPTSFVATTPVGCVGFDVTGLSQVTKDSVVISFGDAATLALSTVTTTATVKVGSVQAATVTLSANKASYAAGEAITLTLTFKDAYGRLIGAGVGTGTLAAALTSSASLSGAALFATANTSKLGITTALVYAPLTAGTVTLTGKTGTDATYLATAMRDVALSASVTVTDGNAAIATSIASLNAKIVALNALIAKIMKRLNIR